MNTIILYPGATHRFYESRRRLFNDSRPQRKEPALKAKLAAKRKEVRRRVRKYRCARAVLAVQHERMMS